MVSTAALHRETLSVSVPFQLLMQAAALEGHPAAGEEGEEALLRRLEGEGEAEAEVVAWLARMVCPLEQMPGRVEGRGR